MELRKKSRPTKVTEEQKIALADEVAKDVAESAVNAYALGVEPDALISTLLGGARGAAEPMGMSPREFGNMLIHFANMVRDLEDWKNDDLSG